MPFVVHRFRNIVTIADDGILELQATEQSLAAVEDRVLGALEPEEGATLHCLLMRAAGGRLPPGACTAVRPD